jgi:hypothetical protein
MRSSIDTLGDGGVDQISIEVGDTDRVGDDEDDLQSSSRVGCCGT